MYPPVFWYGCMGGIVSHHLKCNNIEILINKRCKVIIVEILSYLIMFRIYVANPTIAQYVLKIYDYKWWQSYTAVSPFYPLLLLLLEIAGSNCSLGRFTSQPKIVFLGEISYSVYLAHMICMRIVLAYFNTEWGTFEAYDTALLMAYLSGYTLFKLVEEPSVKSTKYILNFLDKCSKKSILLLRRNQIQYNKADLELA